MIGHNSRPILIINGEIYFLLYNSHFENYFSKICLYFVVWFTLLLKWRRNGSAFYKLGCYKLSLLGNSVFYFVIICIHAYQTVFSIFIILIKYLASIYFFKVYSFTDFILTYSALIRHNFSIFVLLTIPTHKIHVLNEFMWV